MTSKKKINKPGVKRGYLVTSYTVGLMVLLIALTLTWFLIIRPIFIKQETKQHLDSANTQLQLTFETFMSHIPGDSVIKSQSPQKICAEQSVEAGHGNIRCSSTFSVTASGSSNLMKYSELLKTTLNQQAPKITAISDIKYTETSSPLGVGGQFTFNYLNTDLDCGVWNHSSAATDTVDVLAWCRKDVTDFLPGYTVEK